MIFRREKNEPILISIIGDVSSGKNHFLYGLLSSVLKFEGPTALDNRGKRDFDTFFYRIINAADFYKATKEEFCFDGIKQTSKVKFSEADEERLPVFSTTILGKDFYFINVPGGFFEDGNGLRSYINSVDMNSIWNKLKLLNTEDSASKQDLANLIVNEINNLKKHIDENNILQRRDISSSEYFLSYLFFKNSDFVFNLINGDNKSFALANIIDNPKKTLFVLSKADLIKESNNKDYFQQIYTINNNNNNVFLNDYYKLFKNILDNPTIINTDLKNDLKILPVLFYVFQINNNTVILDGKKLYKNDGGVRFFNFETNQIKNLFNQYINISETKNETFHESVLSTLKGLGYNIALLYMIKNLMIHNNEKIINKKYSNEKINNKINEFISTYYQNNAELEKFIKNFVFQEKN